MNDQRTHFTSLSEPVFTVTTLDDPCLCDSLWALELATEYQLIVRVCRASEMRNVDDLFREFAAAFQFPYYFGQNWAAFDECLSDLSWLPAKAYLLCIRSADQLLVDEIPGSFEVFIKTLRSVANEWLHGSHNHALDGRGRTPFHVLMQVPKNAELKLSNRLNLLGEQVEAIDG